MNETKPKYDAIPLTPPPLPRPEPALFGAQPVDKVTPKKSTHPEPIAVMNPTTPTTAPQPSPNMPEWLKTIFVPSRTHGVLAVAATSLFGGWYGVKTLFPPAIDRGSGSVAKTDTNEPPKTLYEFSKPAGSPTIQEPMIPDLLQLTPQVVATTSKSSSGGGEQFYVPIPNTTQPLLQVGHSEPTPKAIDLAPVPVQIPAAIPNATNSGDPKLPVVPNIVFDQPSQLPITIPGAASPSGTTPMAPGGIAPAGGTPPVAPFIPNMSMGPELKPPDIKLDLGMPNVTLPNTPTPVVGIPSATGATAPGAPVTLPTTAPGNSTPGNGNGLTLPTPTATGSGSTLPSTIPSVPLSVVPDLNLRPAPPTTVVQPLIPSSPPSPVALPGNLTSGLTPAVLTTPSPSLTHVSANTAITDFDVDLHYVKQGESFASIAKQHYGDERYSQALEQFNRRNSFDGRVVQVPPTHWIRKQVGQPSGMTSTPTTSAPTPNLTTPGSNADWQGVSTTNTNRFYELSAPKTFRELAKEAYGSEQDWERVFNLNPNYSSDAVLPAGTRIRLTADARIGR